MSKTTFACKEIANFLQGDLIGDPERIISSINRIEQAGSNDLTFLSNAKYVPLIPECKAACIVVSRGLEFQPKEGQTYILVDDAHESFANILRMIESITSFHEPGIHPTAVIDESATVDDSAYIGPKCVIMKGCKIGSNSVLMANVTLYENVQIGSSNRLHAGVVCYQDTIIGNNCIIHAGAVVGSDGFGYTEGKDGSYTKIPQLGNVLIGDNVEIGANTTIDRAIAGSTIIANGVKLDNLIQIAHNAEIGENSAFASQVGVSGSVKIGKRVKLAGQVGVAGHISLADDTVILAQSGIAQTIEKGGIYFGSPAKERMQAFRIEMALRELPQLITDVRKLKKQFTESGKSPEA